MEDPFCRAGARLAVHAPAHGTARVLVEFLAFGVKQAWACLFGGLLLALILASRWGWPADLPVARYDALFVAAVGVQWLLLRTRLEQPAEAGVILVFHVVGTVMELFKTQVGSWHYPEASVIRIAQVPLFTGFMYAAVGSYMARVVRVFDIRLQAWPSHGATLALAAAIYANFFMHHFMPDLRMPLFVATAWLFGRTRMYYRVLDRHRAMPLLLAFALVAAFIWLAENVATWARIWVYPSQRAGWVPVSLGKLGSWYLLMIISVVLVTLVHPPRAPEHVPHATPDAPPTPAA